MSSQPLLKVDFIITATVFLVLTLALKKLKKDNIERAAPVIKSESTKGIIGQIIVFLSNVLILAGFLSGLILCFYAISTPQALIAAYQASGLPFLRTFIAIAYVLGQPDSSYFAQGFVFVGFASLSYLVYRFGR